jgi:hypothetical protein
MKEESILETVLRDFFADLPVELRSQIIEGFHVQAMVLPSGNFHLTTCPVEYLRDRFGNITRVVRKSTNH